jgi:hypothetical protein
MWDTCKGWWEGKIKVEVDEVRFLYRSRGDRHCCNSTPRLAKLWATKFGFGFSPTRALRRIRRNLIDNFSTALPPASRVLGLGHRNSFPTHPLPTIWIFEFKKFLH